MCRGRIYASLVFRRPATGRMYAAPTLPSARRNPIAVIAGVFQQTLKGGVIVGCSARGESSGRTGTGATDRHGGLGQAWEPVRYGEQSRRSDKAFSTAPRRGDNPPYPPLSGGKKKQNPLQPGEGASPFVPPLSGGQEKTKAPLSVVSVRRWASPFYTPLSRGGRGGWFSG